MVMNTSEAEELVKFATPILKQNKTLGLIDHELRFLKTMRTMKELVKVILLKFPQKIERILWKTVSHQWSNNQWFSSTQ